MARKLSQRNDYRINHFSDLCGQVAVLRDVQEREMRVYQAQQLAAALIANGVSETRLRKIAIDFQVTDQVFPKSS